MPLLDAVPTNIFIFGTAIFAGLILFLILTKVPDEKSKESRKVGK